MPLAAWENLNNDSIGPWPQQADVFDDRLAIESLIASVPYYVTPTVVTPLFAQQAALIIELDVQTPTGNTPRVIAAYQPYPFPQPAPLITALDVITVPSGNVPRLARVPLFAQPAPLQLPVAPVLGEATTINAYTATSGQPLFAIPAEVVRAVAQVFSGDQAIAPTRLPRALVPQVADVLPWPALVYEGTTTPVPYKPVRHAFTKAADVLVYPELVAEGVSTPSPFHGLARYVFAQSAPPAVVPVLLDEGQEAYDLAPLAKPLFAQSAFVLPALVLLYENVIASQPTTRITIDFSQAPDVFEPHPPMTSMTTAVVVKTPAPTLVTAHADVFTPLLVLEGGLFNPPSSSIAYRALLSVHTEIFPAVGWPESDTARAPSPRIPVHAGWVASTDAFLPYTSPLIYSDTAFVEPPTTPTGAQDVAIHSADETGNGQPNPVSVELIVGGMPVAWDPPGPTIRVYHLNTGGSQVTDFPSTVMPINGSGTSYTIAWTPAATGVYMFDVRGAYLGVPIQKTQPITVRSIFDPIAIALHDIFVNRTLIS